MNWNSIFGRFDYTKVFARFSKGHTYILICRISSSFFFSLSYFSSNGFYFSTSCNAFNQYLCVAKKDLDIKISKRMLFTSTFYSFQSHIVVGIKIMWKLSRYGDITTNCMYFILLFARVQMNLDFQKRNILYWF